MGLPWTEYQADKAAALAAWWASDERDNFMALAAATNTAETAYQTTINAAFTTWATNTAAAEKTFVIADANNQYDRDVLNFAADEGYQIDLADAEGDWQNGKAANLKARRIDFWTDKRDAVVNHDSTFVDLWELRTLMPDPADEPLDRAYFVAESTANGTRRIDKATNWRAYVTTLNTASVAFVNSTGTADEGYNIAEATAHAARGVAIAQATASHDVSESQTLSDAIDAIAASSGTPWAAYDAAIAEATDAYTDTVVPALRDQKIAIANADRDFEIAVATATRVLSISAAVAQATGESSVANAERDRAISESNAEVVASQTLPLNRLASVLTNAAGASPNGAPSGGQSGGTTGAPPQTSPQSTPKPVGTPKSKFGEAVPQPATGTAPKPDDPNTIPLLTGNLLVIVMPAVVANSQQKHSILIVATSTDQEDAGDVAVDSPLNSKESSAPPKVERPKKYTKDGEKIISQIDRDRKNIPPSVVNKLEQQGFIEKAGTGGSYDPGSRAVLEIPRADGGVDTMELRFVWPYWGGAPHWEVERFTPNSIPGKAIASVEELERTEHKDRMLNGQSVNQIQQGVLSIAGGPVSAGIGTSDILTGLANLATGEMHETPITASIAGVIESMGVDHDNAVAYGQQGEIVVVIASSLSHPWGGPELPDVPLTRPGKARPRIPGTPAPSVPLPGNATTAMERLRKYADNARKFLGTLQNKIGRHFGEEGQGNVAVAELEIADEVNRVPAFSGKRNVDKFAKYVPNEQRKLPTGGAGGWKRPRDVDAEAKILERVFEMTTAETRGTLRLFSELIPCEACSPLIEQFHKYRPYLTIEVYWTKMKDGTINPGSRILPPRLQ